MPQQLAAGESTLAADNVHFNIADIFECVVDAVPERTALVCGDRRRTYRELAARVNKCAHALAAHGVGPSDNVGIFLFNGLEHVETLLACYALRAVPININYRYIPTELEHIVRDADLGVLIYHSSLGECVSQSRGRLPSLKTLVVVQDGPDSGAMITEAADYETFIGAGMESRDFAPRSADDHYILYTGGTTGFPKGVVWRHEDIFWAVFGSAATRGVAIERAADIGQLATADPVVGMPLCPLMHASGQWATLGMLLGGGTVILSADHHLDPDAAWAVIARERVNSVTVVGDAVALPMLDALERGSYDLSALMAVSSGGSILSPETKARLLRALPELLVIDAFGSSETGSQALAMDARGGNPGSLQFPLNDHTTVFDDHFQPVLAGSGIVGRVARRGHIPLGYYNDAEKTAATFLTVDGERWSLPGDMATIEVDGSIRLVGRGALCINTGGEKVFPDEVEAALKSYPDIIDAVVVGVPDQRWGECVAAVVSAAPGLTVDLDRVAMHCRKAIASYKVPRRFVVVAAVVRSAAGKPDYAWAREQLKRHASASPAGSPS